MSGCIKMSDQPLGKHPNNFVFVSFYGAGEMHKFSNWKELSPSCVAIKISSGKLNSGQVQHFENRAE